MLSRGARPATPPQLHWLPSVASWSERLRALEHADDTVWAELVALANAGLEAIETLSLDRKLTRLFGKAPPVKLSTRPVRLALLASSTVDHLKPAIRVGALRHGLWLDIHTPPYGQISSALLDETSELHRYKPDCVLFALDARHVLSGVDASGTREYAAAALDGVLEDIKRNWRLAQDAFGCRVIQQTLMPVFPVLAGNNEHRLPGSAAWLTQEINQRLRAMADAEQVDLLALDTRVAQDGLAAWHDPALWFRAKQDVHPMAAPVYGELIGRLLAARQGRSAKCLVLDLDNTLWGGVIGDDGLDGIVLGQGSARGEAHVAFQRYVRDLSRRGVILAVCSKNDEANALEPFDKHTDMVLKRSDIACFVANWSDKPSNLREIATRLNIGVDALVFADDNPFERDIVRRELPMVAVPELPEDPALYTNCIADAGYFEAAAITSEDFERAGQYRANAERDGLRASATDLEGYLRSLDMELRWARFDTLGLQRIVQLINKTNQFNLTTRRYSEAEAVAVMKNPRALSLQLRLLDRFGDNGVIGIVIGEFAPGSSDMVIDTWLMSCRVLGRQVEQATLNLVAAEAARLGAKRLIGGFRPTAKNGMVREHYPNLGFAKLDETEEGVTRWALDLGGFTPANVIMNIVHAESVAA